MKLSVINERSFPAVQRGSMEPTGFAVSWLRSLLVGKIPAVYGAEFRVVAEGVSFEMIEAFVGHGLTGCLAIFYLRYLTH